MMSQREREMSLRDITFAASFLKGHFSCSVSYCLSHIFYTLVSIYLFFLSPFFWNTESEPQSALPFGDSVYVLFFTE